MSPLPGFQPSSVKCDGIVWPAQSVPLYAAVAHFMRFRTADSVYKEITLIPSLFGDLGWSGLLKRLTVLETLELVRFVFAELTAHLETAPVIGASSTEDVAAMICALWPDDGDIRAAADLLVAAWALTDAGDVQSQIAWLGSQVRTIGEADIQEFNDRRRQLREALLAGHLSDSY